MNMVIWSLAIVGVIAITYLLVKYWDGICGFIQGITGLALRD